MTTENNQVHLTASVPSEGHPGAGFGSIRAAALALYKPPFKFRHGYIHDNDGRMVADQDGVYETVLARVRGWGRIQYLDKPELRAEALQDEVGAILAEALTQFWRNANSAPATKSEPE